MVSNAQIIYDFLKKKGLPDQAIAGIMGNLWIESHFDGGDATAYKDHDSVGIAQWRLGRRENLFRFAQQHGRDWRDLGIQLEFMWQEAQSMGVINMIRGASASQAATIWDQKYEISSGVHRQHRINTANQILEILSRPQTVRTGQGTSATGYDWGALAGPTGGQVPAPVNTGSMSGPGTAGYQGFDNTPLSPEEWKQQLGPVAYEFIQNNPELRNLLNRAMSEGWEESRWQQEVLKTNWYMSSSGPAELAKMQVKAVLTDYGVTISAQTMDRWAKEVVAGWRDVNSMAAEAKKLAKSMYPSLAGQIDAGLTVRDVADPYRQTFAQLLEVNPEGIDFMKERWIRDALQNKNPDGSAAAGPMSMTDFERKVRQHHRYQYTRGAHEEAAQILMHLGEDWGFA